MDPSELMQHIEQQMGDDWAEHVGKSYTIERPEPGKCPPGWNPSDVVSDMYIGKSVESARWKIITEYVPQTNEFSMTFWTTDDEAMTSSEAKEYAAAILEMSAYLTNAESKMKAVALV